MKTKTALLSLLLVFSCAIGLAADPAPALVTAPVDYQSVAVNIRSQRDAAMQALQDAQVQIAMLQKQVADLTAKVAELQKALDAAKTPPATKNPS